MNRKPQLNERDYANMALFFGHVLDDYKGASITKEEAVGALAQAMAALDLGNYDEARQWFQEGRKLIASTR